METVEETLKKTIVFVLSTHQDALSDNAHSVASLKFTERPFTELYLAMTFTFL